MSFGLKTLYIPTFLSYNFYSVKESVRARSQIWPADRFLWHLLFLSQSSPVPGDTALRGEKFVLCVWITSNVVVQSTKLFKSDATKDRSSFKLINILTVWLAEADTSWEVSSSNGGTLLPPHKSQRLWSVPQTHLLTRFCSARRRAARRARERRWFWHVSSSITADLCITQLNINTPPKHVGNYPSLSEEVWLLQATSSIDKKKHKKIQNKNM